MFSLPQRTPRTHAARPVFDKAPQPSLGPVMALHSAIAPEIASPIKMLVATPHEPSGAMVRTVKGSSGTGNAIAGKRGGTIYSVRSVSARDPFELPMTSNTAAAVLRKWRGLTVRAPLLCLRASVGPRYNSAPQPRRIAADSRVMPFTRPVGEPGFFSCQERFAVQEAGVTVGIRPMVRREAELSDVRQRPPVPAHLWAAAARRIPEGCVGGRPAPRRHRRPCRRR